MSALAAPVPRFWAVALAGCLSLAAAMGIGRFAFTPVLPLMIREGSLDVAAGGWLAAVNYGGYLLGAMTAASLGVGARRLALASLAGIVVATGAMGAVHSLGVWLLLRFAGGVFSAWAMVATSAWCLGWLGQFERRAGPGLLYAGVGVGIAAAGLWCWGASAWGESAGRIWWQLGALALLAWAAIVVLTPRDAAPAAPAAAVAGPTQATGSVPWSLVACYGVLGFGYILPATFLPVLARRVVDDPALFGAAWPVFGLAAAGSTVAASLALHRLPRRQVLAWSHALMALGCLLPVLALSALTVLVAALLVGGTFMVATMAGMQEAKAVAGPQPTRALGRMTAAFAWGQLAGPVLSSMLAGLSRAEGALRLALLVAALALAGSAVFLWLARLPRAASSTPGD